MSFIGIGDSIAILIWKQLNQFGSEVKRFFEDQFYSMNCILLA